MLCYDDHDAWSGLEYELAKQRHGARGNVYFMVNEKGGRVAGELDSEVLSGDPDCEALSPLLTKVLVPEAPSLSWLGLWETVSKRFGRRSNRRTAARRKAVETMEMIPAAANRIAWVGVQFEHAGALRTTRRTLAAVTACVAFRRDLLGAVPYKRLWAWLNANLWTEGLALRVQNVRSSPSKPAMIKAKDLATADLATADLATADLATADLATADLATEDLATEDALTAFAAFALARCYEAAPNSRVTREVLRRALLNMFPGDKCPLTDDQIKRVVGYAFMTGATAEMAKGFGCNGTALLVPEEWIIYDCWLSNGRNQAESCKTKNTHLGALAKRLPQNSFRLDAVDG
ncbi:hypothetical protein GNI_131120 [Gregarina niphandrodes]|uniref:Uncharacterized protein n=1 Tax=Gregarina niphandrodes TaxID=110365 RepID=A0A023B209_GRENI|nr:hypothetical protein GNI_131120 [Gregarina niphandrodes]EZG47484.1 hypothetical protein GNI_131120 [Gregarina niphandrodes]|eukprot:XP_011132170.1 hypothetical protein GNI_131120 [Gregarina niphandrodes]